MASSSLLFFVVSGRSALPPTEDNGKAELEGGEETGTDEGQEGRQRKDRATAHPRQVGVKHAADLLDARQADRHVVEHNGENDHEEGHALNFDERVTQLHENHVHMDCQVDVAVTLQTW